MPLRKRVHDGVEMTDSFVVHMTAASNLVAGGFTLWGFSLANLAGSDIKVTIQLIPNGGGEAESKVIFENNIVARTTIFVRGPWWADSGAFIKAKQYTSGTDVVVRYMATEEY